MTQIKLNEIFYSCVVDLLRKRMCDLNFIFHISGYMLKEKERGKKIRIENEILIVTLIVECLFCLKLVLYRNVPEYIEAGF